MKKLVIAVLAIGAMAACTKSNIQYEQPEEISFQPVAKKATKAVNGAIDGAQYPVTENFKVWAWWADIAPNSTPSYKDYSNLYINKGEFQARDYYNWGGVKKYYWPTSGSLVFAGYSPAVVDGGTFTYTLSEDDSNVNTFEIAGYVQSTDIKTTKDLMWFDAGKSYLEKSITYNDPMDPELRKGVPVVFKHALSWLEFRFNLTAGAPENWRIYAVKLKEIETKGSFTATTGASASKTWLVDFNSTGEFIVAEDLTYDLTTKSEAYNLTKDSEKGVVIIPQSCAKNNDITLSDAYLEISYGLLTPATEGEADEVNKKYIPQTVTLPLTYTDNSSIKKDAWEPGYHYIYTITFGANEILISPSVAEWTVENENIDVE